VCDPREKRAQLGRYGNLPRALEIMKRYILDPTNPPQLTKTDLSRIDRLKDSDIDYSDIPPLDEEFFKKAKQVAWPPTKVTTNKNSPPRKRSKPA
jgi:hypothetical protein